MKKNRSKSSEKAYNELAIERTILSNQRTTLSYIRTGLTTFALGLALVKIFEETKSGIIIGIITSGIGISFFLIGLYYHNKEKRIIEREKEIMDQR